MELTGPMRDSKTSIGSIMAMRKRLTYKQNVALGVVAGFTTSVLVFGSLGVMGAVMTMRAKPQVTSNAPDVKEMMRQIGRTTYEGRKLDDCLVEAPKAVCSVHYKGEQRFLVIKPADRP